jgi:hypothetical protein
LKVSFLVAYKIKIERAEELLADKNISRVWNFLWQNTASWCKLLFLLKVEIKYWLNRLQKHVTFLSNYRV